MYEGLKIIIVIIETEYLVINNVTLSKEGVQSTKIIVVLKRSEKDVVQIWVLCSLFAFLACGYIFVINVNSTGLVW